MPFSRAAKLRAAAAISRCWVTWYRLRYGRRVHFGRGFLTNGRLVIRGPGRVIFGPHVNAWSHAEKNVLTTYTPASRIIVGAGTRLNGAGIMARTEVRIGSACILGSTTIFDSDFHPLDPALRHHRTAPVASGPITIGTNVWLGGQSAVLKGCTIGENAVVAFRAVVTSDVPPNVVVAGNPARVIKTLGGADLDRPDARAVRHEDEDEDEDPSIMAETR